MKSKVTTRAHAIKKLNVAHATIKKLQNQLEDLSDLRVVVRKSFGAEGDSHFLGSISDENLFLASYMAAATEKHISGALEEALNSIA